MKANGGAAATAASVRFGSVEFDGPGRRLRRDGSDVAVEPQVFDVLAYLIEHRQRVVPKEELLDEVWGDRFVSESAITSRVKSVRQAVGDDGRAQRIIRTVHGRGYQFVAEVEVDTGHLPDDAAAFGGAPVVVPTRIAPPVKPLIDRVEVSARIRETILSNRLVTMVGPAGVGKTHLCQHVAASLADDFPDGSWFVPLAALRDGDALGQVVLDALGQQRFPTGSAEETLVGTLSPKAGLLVLDNCEHVLDATAKLVEALLGAGGPLTIIATSRQRLGVGGEHLVDVPVLEERYGVELFTNRASEHGLDLGADNRLVAEVCGALDHLPLALELASAQSRVLGLDHLAGLLDERMHLLVGSGGQASHHHTLEGAIADSFNALDPALQQTLGRLSQFAGWFDLAAATSMATADTDLGPIDAIHQLVELAERSLIEADVEGEPARYRLLESIRLFAERQVEDLTTARSTHLTLYRDRLERCQTRLNGRDFEAAFDEIGRDWANHRRAVSFAVDLDRIEDGLRLVNASIDYAEVTQSFELVSWTERLLDRLQTDQGVDPAVVAEARAALARLISYQGEWQRAADLVGDEELPAVSFSSAMAQFWRAGAEGDTARVEAFAGEAQRLAGGGLRELTAAAVAHLAATFVDGIDIATVADGVRRVAGEGGVGRSYTLMVDGYEALRDGNTALALLACAEWIEVARAKRLEVLASQAFAVRVTAVRDHDDVGLVARCVADALRHYRSRGHWAAARNDGIVAARVLLDAGDVEGAAMAFAGFVPLRYRTPGPAYVEAIQRCLEDEDDGIASHAGPAELAPDVYCERVTSRLEAFATGHRVVTGPDKTGADGDRERA